MLHLFPWNLVIFFSLKSEYRWSQWESTFPPPWGWDEHEEGGIWSSSQGAKEEQKQEEKEHMAQEKSDGRFSAWQKEDTKM